MLFHAYKNSSNVHPNYSTPGSKIDPRTVVPSMYLIVQSELCMQAKFTCQSRATCTPTPGLANRRFLAAADRSAIRHCHGTHLPIAFPDRTSAQGSTHLFDYLSLKSPRKSHLAGPPTVEMTFRIQGRPSTSLEELKELARDRKEWKGLLRKRRVLCAVHSND
ncbi:hypothetical protein Bbelb_161480 [Branchiostoma belcheri]|nr:hypothetical protein Bbelb_161480 [Branchiostoma belcheri]